MLFEILGSVTIYGLYFVISTASLFKWLLPMNG